MSPLYFFVCIGLVAAGGVESDEPSEKSDRSIFLPARTNCVAQWQTINPCVNNPLGQLNFPLPGDTGKFVQCGTNSRMFIVQCPAGEVYDQATSTCIKTKQVVAMPIYNIGTFGVRSPCTAQNIALGRIFFGLNNNKAKFLQCMQNGNAQILTCPSQMVWNQNKQSCVFPSGTPLLPGTVGIGTNSLTGLITGTTTSNPCSAQAVATNQLYFSHSDPTKFIQCDLHGNAFVQQCPSGLAWNQAQETCANKVSAVTGVTGISGVNGINGLNGMNGMNGITGITGVIQGLVPGFNGNNFINVGNFGLLNANNPCSMTAIASNQLYFAHPDATKFIQCDLHGNAYIKQCPGGLTWNQLQESCA